MHSQSLPVDNQRMLTTNLANIQSDTDPTTSRLRDIRLLTIGRSAVALGRRRYSTRGATPETKTAAPCKPPNNCISSSNGNSQDQQRSSEVLLLGQEIHFQEPKFNGNRCSDSSGITLPDFGPEEFSFYDNDEEEFDDFCRPCGSVILEEIRSQFPGTSNLLHDGSTDSLPSMPRRRSSNLSLISSNPSLLSSYQHSHSSSYLRRISNLSKSENDKLPQPPSRSMSTGTASLSTNVEYSVLHASFGASCVIEEEETEASTEAETATEESPIVTVSE